MKTFGTYSNQSVHENKGTEKKDTRNSSIQAIANNKILISCAQNIHNWNKNTVGKKNKDEEM